MNEIQKSIQQQTGNYSVRLASVGNPDFRQDPTKPLYGVRNKNIKVSTMEAASNACMDYIDEHELGFGNWAGGQVTDDDKLVAQISYNGRVWEILS